MIRVEAASRASSVRNNVTCTTWCWNSESDRLWGPPSGPKCKRAPKIRQGRPIDCPKVVPRTWRISRHRTRARGWVGHRAQQLTGRTGDSNPRVDFSRCFKRDMQSISPFPSSYLRTRHASCIDSFRRRGICLLQTPTSVTVCQHRKRTRTARRLLGLNF